MKVVIIGAGPSGIVALKTLREHHFDAILLEATGDIGGAFKHKAYDNGRLVSSKYITAFSDYRMGPKVNDHPSMDVYVEYLKEYCDEFNLWPYIKFHKTVVEIKGKYIIRCTNETFHADAVCICSGLHNTPFVPDVPGNFTGEMIHSSAYKDRSIFNGKKVLIVGCGETGLDISYRAVLANAKSVNLVVRSGFLSVPTTIESVPLDTLITNFMECSYQHPLAEKWKLKWRFTTIFIRLGFFIATGSLDGFNQWGGTIPNVKRGHYIINKSTKAIPYINRSLKRSSFLGKHLWGFWDSEANPNLPDIGLIESSIVKFENHMVTFGNGISNEYDIIIWATGYQLDFPFLPKSNLPELRNICTRDEPTKAFIGFVRPNVGAIPPMAEMQIMWWIKMLQDKISLPLNRATYRLLSPNARTGSYGVDYGAYMHDLARDIGAVPSVEHWIFKNWRVAVAYALGQAYTTFFRLEGPYVHPKAEQISETELYSPVVTRPLASNVIFLITIFIFTFVNMICYIIGLFIMGYKLIIPTFWKSDELYHSHVHNLNRRSCK